MDKLPLLGRSASADVEQPTKHPNYQTSESVASARSPAIYVQSSEQRNNGKPARKFLYYVVYAIVNVIISAPGLYGYAAVIFNHPIYANHMNALSKLVIFSSLVHQVGFLLFSSLNFAIGTVQDAGLIFLSHMSSTIANIMIDDGESEEAILSTTLVLLSLGTAALGLVLIVIGRCGFASAVSYLPMSVVGGYLAFIGYFCIQAGVALCISHPLVSFVDWSYVLSPKNFLLAFPGLVSGGILTYVSRSAKSEAALPLTMISIPIFFYIIIGVTGVGLEGAREGNWVGRVAPSVPVVDLFTLVDFSLVRWDLIGDIASTWIGMVFVVSFASSLDVAAISTDMGEALDFNRELATVGICNLMSGLTFGFTGSYIFSQTIFTYRTGVHSRWIGFLIIVMFAYIVYSPINILQVSPLFFLGATLIFIGFDLFYEWLWDIRHQVFLSEYGVIWLTFFAIQVVGIDAGIIVGVLIAILQQVVWTAKDCSVNRIQKRSRAVWTKEEDNLLALHAYNSVSPRIVTIEITGTIFFGSSLQLLDQILQSVGLQGQEQTSSQDILRSPHTSSFVLTMERKPSIMRDPNKVPAVPYRPPKYVVLDLLHVHNLDTSGTRGCFLQLSKICSKQKIILCAASPTPRMEFMFRSHNVAYDSEEEEKMKARLQSRQNSSPHCERMLLFLTAQEALEFCETAMLQQLNKTTSNRPPSLPQRSFGPEDQSLSNVFAHLLRSDDHEWITLRRLDGGRYHDEIELSSGHLLFQKEGRSDAFYVVLRGAVANTTGSARSEYRQNGPIISGAGFIEPKFGSKSNLIDSSFAEQHSSSSRKPIASIWSVGGVLGYRDFLQERPRHFRAIATQDGTRVAQFTHSQINLVKKEDPELHALIIRVLLRASILDLSNCTCGGV